MRVEERWKEVEAEQGVVKGEVELTPIQRWLMEQGMEEVNHYNQAVMVEMDSGVRVEEMREVVRKMVEHHDALRMRYRREEGGGWRQENLGEERCEIVEEIDLRGVEEGEEKEERIREAVERLERSLDIERGPMMKVGVMEVGKEVGEGGRMRR